jgi:hypothetical protein
MAGRGRIIMTHAGQVLYALAVERFSKLTDAEGKFLREIAAGEVVFAAAGMLKHQVFNSPPNMNRTYFRLRQQHQKCG